MLEEALVALAATGGSAVVQAAGTEAWAGLRQAVARWFGRGDGRRQQGELERLDRTATALQTTDGAEAERGRLRLEATWQARIEAVLESLDEAERDRAADELRSLLAQHAPGSGVSAGPGSLAVGGTANIRAEGGSIAAGVIHGGAHIGNPQLPDPSQG
ncbi:hypothetical protein HEK616_32250 [Streptomyces nigrescens]|uniref:Uncharacterized protein n=2 Tax=Streptomyces TaxID=1883 RepID=A0ABN6QY23_STRNI|nr:hypothetical protein [Streptomyces nigrescens]MEE4417932.1 hypothetical protein [Streptomyces sp. DSM 41528]BDM69738.1 hypothetical protein HEK616_32250 [Streptomyces nigrescens]